MDLDLFQRIAVAGGPGPVAVPVDVGCGGGPYPNHLAWHTKRFLVTLKLLWVITPF